MDKPRGTKRLSTVRWFKYPLVAARSYGDTPRRPGAPPFGRKQAFAAVANRSDHIDRSGILHPTRQAEYKTAETPQFVGICIAVGIAIDLGMVLDPRIGVDVPKALECTFERVIVVRIV